MNNLLRNEGSPSNSSTTVLNPEIQETKPNPSSVLVIFPFGATTGSCNPVKPEEGNLFGEEVVKKLLEENKGKVTIAYAETQPYGVCNKPINHPDVIFYSNHHEIPKDLFDRLAVKGSMNYFAGEEGYELYKRLVVADLRVVLKTMLQAYEKGQNVDNVVLLGMYRPSLATVKDILEKLFEGVDVDEKYIQETLASLNTYGIWGIKKLLRQKETREAEAKNGNMVNVKYFGIVDSCFVPDGNKFQIKEIPDSHPLRFLRDVLPGNLKEYFNRSAELIFQVLSIFWSLNINKLRSRLGLPPMLDFRQALYGDRAVINDNPEIAGVKSENTFSFSRNVIHVILKVLFGFNYPSSVVQERVYVGPLVGKLSGQDNQETEQKMTEFLGQKSHIVVVNMGSTGTVSNLHFVLKTLQEAIKDKDDKNIGIIILGAGHSSDELGIQELLEDFGDKVFFVDKFNPLKLYDKISQDNGILKYLTLFIHGGRGTLYDFLLFLKSLSHLDINIVGIPTQAEQEANIKRLKELLGGDVVTYLDPYYVVKFYDMLRKLGLGDLFIQKISSFLVERMFNQNSGEGMQAPVLLDYDGFNGYRRLSEVLNQALIVK